MKRTVAALAGLVGMVTKAREFQLLRRDRSGGDVEYQIFADTDDPPDGVQVAWVNSTRHDAEFIAWCLNNKAEIARLATDLDVALEALKEFVEWHGGAHADGCPADDTCDCIGAALNQRVNAAIAKGER